MNCVLVLDSFISIDFLSFRTVEQENCKLSKESHIKSFIVIKCQKSALL